ncbi:Piso0_002035 [Millerozyma farinosa CBS 7064]|uniref:Glutamate--tRNA ligase, mitochondrial n=1 Tax=Pichia sorbitophila (strain ATCC MYA-4447 / BCRC 22081 / CBS 7064 / NBRC 10061 / NRRL Y-12695) TaxID=559304 RepID=G8YBI4_PICSO|nr:Piso0_002035 [Millerozyma farinosa CBS 7064]
MYISRRWCASGLSFRRGAKQSKSPSINIHPKEPARTRFAPSPTGHLHLGSLRTALYNYLLAKNTDGQFLLRLEDTDQKRLVPGAENSIYETLKWCGLKIDEGPQEGGPFAPYRQSDRMDIYKKYANQLLQSGHAYICVCSKERLDHLRESATMLKPPTTVTYDRKCFHNHEKSIGEDYVIRFKSPEKYSPVSDLLHGSLNLQPQVNASDRRYDDFVIMKSDGLPTYHFANVIDDHLMKITHVIRGEEWLASTPKHLALYEAFGWVPPKYVHIPLLTTTEDKKLSKRYGHTGIKDISDKGILPESLLNFCALNGWAPPRPKPGVSTSEVMDLDELIEKFSLNNLTKGNTKISDSKLYYFNKIHLTRRLGDDRKFNELVDFLLPLLRETFDPNIEADLGSRFLRKAGTNVTCIDDIKSNYGYLFSRWSEDSSILHDAENKEQVYEILEIFLGIMNENMPFDEKVDYILKNASKAKRKHVFESLRIALSNGQSGLAIPSIIEVLGTEETEYRIKHVLDKRNC